MRPDGDSFAALGRRELLAGAVVTALGVGFVPGAASAAVRKFPMPTSGELTVLVTGDAGTGEPPQYAVAAAARRLAVEKGYSLALGLGDNLYLDGAESSDDDEFQTKFELPNAGIDVPWLMILGNHDTSGLMPGGGDGPERGDFEVAYHHNSSRWYMPHRYYSVPLPGAESAPVVEFFALDTNPVASFLPQRDPHYAWDGPFMREQRAWLDERLSASRARWKIVMAHHPYINNGPYGNAGEYNGITQDDYASGKHLKELYEQVVVGRADLILSGHDHCSQILAPVRGTQQIVCGAAAHTEGGQSKVTNEYFWQDFAHHGFMTLNISAAGIVVDAYLVESTDPATATARHAFSHAIRG